MTNDKENTAPIVPPIQSNPGVKEYFCPHCGRSIFKGNVKRINMVCHHCQKMIDTEESGLVGSQTDSDES